MGEASVVAAAARSVAARNLMRLKFMVGVLLLVGCGGLTRRGKLKNEVWGNGSE
jgi:hypothetical protein